MMFLENNNINSNLLESKISTSWKPSHLPLDLAVEKMWINSKKAIEEHHRKDPTSYVSSVTEVSDSKNFSSLIDSIPLHMKSFSCQTQGYRPSMEDAHFVTESEFGVLAGVFDGHNGKEVALLSSLVFKKYFFDYLVKFTANVHQTFECLIDKIHQKVAEKNEWNHIGSTAVICFIDSINHLIYTATLGDSEANIYRKIGDDIKSIPLSCVRDWSCKKEALRASVALNDPELAESLTKKNPKKIYFRLTGNRGINVSRAIGDIWFAGTPEKPGVIHKPKITVNKIENSDDLIIACDGLKDFVSESEIINILKEKHENPARKLVEFAINEKKSKDNVTVIAIIANTV